MKAVALICILLAIMIFGILMHGLYIHQFTSDMIKSLRTVPPSPSELKAQASTLQERWSRGRIILQFTISRAKIEAIDNALDTFCLYTETPSALEFKRAKALLENALEQLTA